MRGDLANSLYCMLDRCNKIDLKLQLYYGNNDRYLWDIITTAFFLRVIDIICGYIPWITCDVNARCLLNHSHTTLKHLARKSVAHI